MREGYFLDDILKDVNEHEFREEIHEWYRGKKDYLFLIHQFAKTAYIYFGSENPEKDAVTFVKYVMAMSRIDDRVDSSPKTERVAQLMKTRDVINGTEPDNCGDWLLYQILAKSESEIHDESIVLFNDLIDIEMSNLCAESAEKVLELRSASGAKVFEYIAVIPGVYNEVFHTFARYVGSALNLGDDVKEMAEDLENDQVTALTVKIPYRPETVLAKARKNFRSAIDMIDPETGKNLIEITTRLYGLKDAIVNRVET